MAEPKPGAGSRGTDRAHEELREHSYHSEAVYVFTLSLSYSKNDIHLCINTLTISGKVHMFISILR